MLEKLLGMADGRYVFPIIVLSGATVLIKALYGVQRSKSQDRRDFLQIWSGERADDLWLQVAIRHQFGEYLPIFLIRGLQRGLQAARALLDVSECWNLLDASDRTGTVVWSAKRYRRPRWRIFERYALLVLYFVLAFVGLMLAFFITEAKADGALNSWVYWIYVVVFVGAAWACLSRQQTLLVAERAMSRWLNDFRETSSASGAAADPPKGDSDVAAKIRMADDKVSAGEREA